MTHTTASPTIARHPRAGRRPTSTGALLNLAVATGPFFALVSAIQIVTRDGFDLRRHPLSQLATGNLGVIQMANFTLAGVGVACLAVALRRLVTAGTGRRWLARLVAGFGLGLIAAGCSRWTLSTAFRRGPQTARLHSCPGTALRMP